MSREHVQAQVDLEVLKQLLPEAERLGISLPGLARFAPTVDVGQTIRALALEIGRIVSAQNLFEKAGALVTVDPETGETDPMTPARFVGWVEDHMAFKNSRGSQRLRDSLSREDAALILEQDIFRGCIRPLEAVHQMRLPVLRESGDLEFLSPGYDAESKIFTAKALEYEMDWALDRATAFLNAHGEGYPWSQAEEGEQPVEQNRSWAVHVAAMVGTYCRACFQSGTTRPMICYIANQPGTGKSTLVSMVLLPVYGHAATTKTPKDDAEMDKELETSAQHMSPYLFFDDIGHGITSSPMNRFITATAHQGRRLGGPNLFHVPAVTQVFATGNDIKISRDLKRRSLIAELFLPGDVRGRKFTRTISQRYLASEETRKQFLSALCAIVRNWAEAVPRRVHPLPLETFEEWTSIIAPMVMLAGYVDPLIAPELTVGGTEDAEDDLRELLVKVASEAEGDCTYNRAELVAKAREWGLMEGVLGTADDGELDGRANKRFGRQLQRWRGRELRDLQGRRFRFSHKRQKNGATYPLSFI